MGMAASSLRFAQLTARKNQVEFEGQQINQQRLTLSQKSSAIYNDMLTKQVPTAPDPSAFTKIVYKFNAGFGESSILNLAKKSSGAYNYNVTYKKPKTTRTLSRSSYSNVGFTSNIGVTTKNPYEPAYYERTANIDGVSRNLTLVGGSTAAEKLANYRSKLETYNNMKTIEEQISALRNSSSTTLDSSTQQSIKNALGLNYKDEKPNNAFETALNNTLTNSSKSSFEPTSMELDSSYPTEVNQKAAYNMAVALGLTQGDDDLSESLTQTNMDAALTDILANPDESPMSTKLRKKLTGDDNGTNLSDSYKFTTNGTDNVSQDDIKSKFANLNYLEKIELANLLAGYANTGDLSTISEDVQVSDDDYDNYNNYINYGKAGDSLYSAANDGVTDNTVTKEQMIAMLEALLREVSKDEYDNTYQSSVDYNEKVVGPAYTQYQASCSTAGIMNISQGQALYSYDDGSGETAYMYVSLDNILDDGSSTYADSVSVYENVLNYLDGETETEQMDANVLLNDDGQVSKITFADGTVVTPEVVTEMDQDAYDQAMVEYDYKKEVYDKEMNDANAKVKIIQAQDQKLEVRLKQLDTEQKALQTEIDAVKSVRDKAIENSFKTFS